jgi:hypothetical protein
MLWITTEVLPVVVQCWLLIVNTQNSSCFDVSKTGRVCVVEYSLYAPS